MTAPPSVTLEPLRPEHAAAMFDGLSDPAAYRFLPGDPPSSVAALRSRYERLSVGRSPDGAETWLNWVVGLRGGTLVGYTQATVRSGVAHVAYQVFPTHWRRGVATAAMRLTLDALFGMATVGEVRALVDTRNTASVCLLRTLGFGHLRTIVDADQFKGSRSDEHEFGLARAAFGTARRYPRQASVGMM